MSTATKNKTFVSTSELAKILGITRQSITNWRNNFEDAPTKKDGLECVKSWRDWLQNHPGVNQSNNSRKSGRRYDLECERLQIKIAQEKVKLAIAQASVMSGENVKARAECIRQIVQKALRTMETLPPIIQGLGASAMIPVFDKWIHRTLSDLSDPTSRLWDGIR